MKTLDDLLSSSMNELSARNALVFETTRSDVHAAIKGGSGSLGVLTTIGVVVMAGSLWFALKPSDVQPVRVKPITIDAQPQVQPTPIATPQTRVQPATTVAPTRTQQTDSKSSMQATVENNDSAIQAYITQEMERAESAERRGDKREAERIREALRRWKLLNSE